MFVSVRKIQALNIETFQRLLDTVADWVEAHGMI